MDTTTDYSKTRSWPHSFLKHGMWVVPLSLIAGLGVWQGLVLWLKFPAFILPGPGLVWLRLLRALQALDVAIRSSRVPHAAHFTRFVLRASGALTT